MAKKQLILIGGGPSISNGVKKGLWSKLKGQYTIGMNFAYKFITPTMLVCADYDFYDGRALPDNIKEEHIKQMKNLPLVVLPEVRGLKKFDNTIFIKSVSDTWHRDIAHGVYRKALVGLLSLSLGIYLLDVGEIFLLGYDFGQARKDKYEEDFNNRVELNKNSKKDSEGRYLTHFYQENKKHLKHRGIGKISFYNQKNKAEKLFGPYKKEKRVKIWNVCPTSRIPNNIFEKATYEQFFDKLDDKQYDQDKLREDIIKKLKEAGYNS